MECLFFLSFSSIILLACYVGTCYLDETLHCNMYGWNLLMYEWIELAYVWMYGTYVLDICDMNACEIYLYMSYIFAVKIVGFNKKQKKEPICRLFAVCHRRQRALCRQPQTAKKPRGSQLCFLGADPFGQFAYSGRRQRVNNFAVSGGRQRPAM